LRGCQRKMKILIFKNKVYKVSKVSVCYNSDLPRTPIDLKKGHTPHKPHLKEIILKKGIDYKIKL
jgi:hypothetical protein